MLSLQDISVIAPSSGRLNSDLSKSGETPETGDFNFIDYLLGLQASQTELDTESMKGEAPPQKGSPISELDTEKIKPSVQSEKEKISWSPMLPGLNSAPQDQGKTPVVKTIPQEVKIPVETGEPAKSKGKLPDVPGFQPEQETTQLNPGSASSETKAANRSKEAALQKYDNMGKQAASTERALTVRSSRDSEVPITGLTPVAEAVLGNQATSENSKKEERSIGSSNGDKDLLSTMLTSNSGQSASPSSVQVQALKPNAVATSTVPEVMNHVATLVQQGGGKMTVSLTPPHLGQLEIQVTSKGKKVEIEMKSESAAAKSLLDSHIGELKNSLHGRDLVLSKVEVHVSHELNPFPSGKPMDSSGNQSAFNQARDSFQGRGHERSSTQEGSPRMRAASILVLPTARRSAVTSGGVDLRI
jgi:flagellar hook-length control protein FliK